jgi:hypothetical protein
LTYFKEIVFANSYGLVQCILLNGLKAVRYVVRKQRDS